MPRPVLLLLQFLALLFFGIFLLWPLWKGVHGAFSDGTSSFTLAYFAELSRNRIYLEGFANTVALAFTSTALALALAFPLALVAARREFPFKKTFSALVLVPMILPPFVGAIGMRQILGQYGALNALLTHLKWLAPGQTIDWLGHGRFWGIAILNALHLYPILYLNLVAALANIDPALGEAAENLGATRWRKLREITLPLVMPGFFAGGTIVFIAAFTELGVPLLFDYTRVTPVQIFYGTRALAANSLPYALVVATLVSTTLLYAAGKWAWGRSYPAGVSKAISATNVPKAGFISGWLFAGGFAGVCALALLPHTGVVLLSFSQQWQQSLWPQSWTLAHYQNALSHGLTVPSIINSLKYAGASTLLDVALGIALAYVITRTNSPARHLLDLFAMLPLAVPGLVLAFGYLAMTQEGTLLEFLNPTRNPTPLLVIAYSVRRLPYVLRAVTAGFQQTSVTLEEAARNLGAGPLRVLGKITLPLISANILAGALFAFAFAMLEVSDSLILAQRQVDFPITKAIYELFQLLGEGRYIASALGVWAMAFLGLAILAGSRLLGKRLGTLFRI